MESPSNYNEGDIKTNIINSNSIKTEIIINTGIFDHSIIIQNGKLQDINNKEYKSKDNITNEEENESEVTEIVETELESSPKISPEATEVDEAEKNNIYENESMDETNEEINSSKLVPLYKINEKNKTEFKDLNDDKKENSLKVEIVEVDKVKLLNIKSEEIENENIPINIIDSDTDIFNHSTLIQTKNPKIEEKAKDEVVKIKGDKAEDISEIPVIRSDNGLWWIFAKSEIKTIEEKESIPTDTKIVTNNFDYNIKEETKGETKKEIIENDKIEDISEIPVIRSDNGLWWIFAKTEVKTIKEKESIPTDTKIVTNNFDHNIKEETNKENNENTNDKAEDISKIPIIKSDNGLWWIFAKTEVKTNEEKEKTSIGTTIFNVTGNTDHSTLIQTSNSRNQEINNENSKINVRKRNENVKENIKNNISKIDEVNLNENSNKKIKIDDNMNTELKYNNEKSILNESHVNASDNTNNLLSTAVYIILSCSENYSFDKKYIEINPKKEDDFEISNSEIHIIKEKNNNFYNELYKKDFNCDNDILCSIKGKNIYLYKVNLLLHKNEVSFTIKIKYFKDFLISPKYKIKYEQQLFISCESLKWENESWIYWNYNSNYDEMLEINKFKANEYQISKLQNFIIFKYYLRFNKMEKYMSNLLKIFMKDIEKSNIIELELIFEILSTIFDNKKSILELPKESKEIFENVVKNLKQKKGISFNNEYKERYHEIVNMIDKYAINIKGELNLCLNLLILIFINSDNNPEKFNEYFNRIYMKEEAVKFIKNNKKSFSYLQSSNLELLFENIKNKNKFNDIVSLASNFNEYLKFFSLKCNYILNEKPKIDFNLIPNPDESTEIFLLISFIEILKNIPIKDKEIDKIKDKINILISKLEKKDLNKLYELKEVSQKYFNILIDKINNTIHTTGNYFIRNNKLNNLEIIKFIHEDAKNFPHIYKTNIEYATLIKYIKLDEVDEEFCAEFNISKGYFYDYKQLLGNNFDSFINSIINCAKTFRHVKIIYNIFDIENKFEYIDKDKRPKNQIISIIRSLVDHIATLDKNEMTTEELGIIFGPLFKLISDHGNHNINLLLKNIIKKFSSKEINEIFAYLLVHQNLNSNMVEKIVENMNELSSDNVISYLNQFENEKIRNLLLKKLDKNIISKNEIFNENLTDNLITLRALINMDYFKVSSNELCQTDYIKKTQKIMMNLCEELEELEFKMDQLKLMNTINKIGNNENNLKNRLFIITLGNQNASNHLYQLLNNKINKCNEIYRKIDEIIKITSYFFPNDKKKIIEFYKRLKEEIMEKPIKEFPDMNQPELEDYENLYNEAHKISGLKRSKFFIAIFENNKKKALNNSTDLSILEDTKEKFFNLKNLFDIETENDVDIKFLEEVISKINNDEMEDEIKILKNIFKIDKPITNDICEKLILLNNKNKTINLLKNIIKLFRDFKLKGKSIHKDIKNVIEKLENNSSLICLTESYESLDKLDLNILNSNSFINLKSIINDIYSKPELMKFIINKKFEDIHQMGEFIDDVEDIIIDLRDINNLESCSSFISELKRYNSLSEKEFLNKFNEIIQEDKFKDIGLKFKDASGKYSDFNELYINHLNPNELNKVHIELVYKLSTFDIQYSGLEYTCKARYKDKEKNFDDMLDLRDVALLRKKDQKEGYLEICDTFANIISNIQEILDRLNIIDSKGYFEEINLIIKIKKGNALAYRKNTDSEGKTLPELIKQLDDIIQNQCKEVKDIYLNYPISRLIYGRQFTYLYKYINDRNYNYNSDRKKIINNILKYVTNNKFKFKIRGIENRAIEDSSLKQMFKNINYYLNVLFRVNNIDINSVFENAKLTNPKSGLYTHYSSDEEIECEAIHCSLNLTGNFPSAQTVLYCNSYTSEDELLSFVYKSVKCEINALFILINPEKLTLKRKKMLIDLLNEHYSLNEMKSCLLILYANENKTDDIITEIEKISYFKYTDIKSEKSNENVIKYIPNVEIYSSEFSGLGKSTLIKKDFKKDFDKSYEYIYFPLGDSINKDEIIQRLLKLPNKNIALHVDLYNSKHIELIREFLFTFLVLRCYSKNEKIFFFEHHTVKIKVEIPNGFINFKTLFPIFKYFKDVLITSDNIPPLIVTNDITSNVQIVCNYLNNIDVINEKDMYFEGITNGNYNSNNHIKAIPLSQEKCQNLILQNLHIENPNYYQIESFINLVAEQLRLFTKSIYLNVEQLNLIKQFKRNSNLNKIRKFFIESLVKITKHFITSSYDNIIKGQNVTYNQQQGKIDLEKANKKANEILTNKKSFSIQQIQPSMILINEDGQSISEIVTCQQYTEEYNLLQAIFNSDSPLESRKIIDYSQLGPDEFLKEVRKVLNLYNKINRYENGFAEELNGKKLRYLKDIVDNYIFTEDNFIKLLLISLRLRTNIPVVMMGETGCGKTSLIKIIAELKGISMHILNIHAGIEDNDIIEFLKEKQLFINEDLNIYNDDIGENDSTNENNSINENDNDNNNNKEQKDIWVFLDEINTCNSLGLITEIMLKHSCKGEKIKNNIKFIAACNPYRLDTGEKEIVGLYDEAKHIDRKLVYNVNPLPHSLLNYVFDFKTPEEEDIKRYISNIVYKTLMKSIPDEDILNKIKTIAVKSLFNAHEFIKTQFDISSVSLREIRRWQILFKWFIELLRKPFFMEKYELPDDQIYLYSLNLSIYLCYYMRIFKKEKRRQFLDEMKKTFGNNFDFERLPRGIQEDIADATELDKGIAKNRPILENLFAIFVCSNTKIPLFIVGKPGCSKTLSAKLIFMSMRGRDSSSKFFKNFPKIYTKSYQGSLNSNSTGILKIFKKARNSLKKLSGDIISAIYFDEMGLAEISNNNPLKVIHSELEYDDNKEKVSFIGISNWPLDASKMNRGIHLSIPEPDEEDLITTSLAIAESYDQTLKLNYNQELENLARSYFEYKQQLKEFPYKFESVMYSSVLNSKDNSKKNINEFHGTRDFYHLIKTFSKLLIKKNFPEDTDTIEKVLCRSIERNFGGLENSVKVFKEIFLNCDPDFKSKVKKEYKVLRCFSDNIRESKSRYILLITNSPVNQFLVYHKLNKLEKYQVFYHGSKFIEDISKGYYCAKILNKIQVTLSNDNVMILKDLESVYPSLYDFFNQNFRKTGECEYARIALGNSNTQNYYVNNNLKCIILLDKSKIHKQDPPFLNRFEKHIISFEYILKKSQIEIAKKIYKLINDYLIEIDKGKTLKIDLKSELINCSLEEIQGFIYKLSIDKNNDDHDHDQNYDDPNIDDQIELYQQKIFEKIVPSFSQDLIIYAKNSSFSQKHRNEFESILNIYLEKEHEHQNLKSYLENICETKHIIYTFSNIIESIFKDNSDIIRNNVYGEFSKETLLEILVNQYSSERSIEGTISDFYNNDKKNLFIIHFNADDSIHLRHISYLISNTETTYKENNSNRSFSNKIILFIIHLRRRILNHEISNKTENNKIKSNVSSIKENKIIDDDNLISHLSEWNQFFIDNLNGIDISLKEIYNASSTDLLNNIKLIDLDDEFKKDLFHAFTNISYNYKINFSSIPNEKYIEYLCEYINTNKKLENMIKNSIQERIQNNKENILLKIYYNYAFEDSDVDFKSVIIKYLKSFYNEELINTLILFENNNILSTKLVNKDIEELNCDYFDEIYQHYMNEFNSSNEKMEYSCSSNNSKIDLFLGISYPCIITVFKEIKFYINELTNDYIDNDNNVRSELYRDNQEYFEKRNLLEENLKIEFEKHYIGDIFKDNSHININYKQKLMKLLFKDYIIFYLSKSNEEFQDKNILDFFNHLYILFISYDDNNNHGINDHELTIESLSKFILFIETYKNCIYSLCKFIPIMDHYFDDFVNYFISVFSSKKFNSCHNKFSCVNDVLCNLLESFVYCILMNQNFNKIQNKSYQQLLTHFKSISLEIMKFNEEFRLILKEILYFNDLIYVIEFFNTNKILSEDNIQKYYEILSNENKMYLLKENNNSIFSFLKTDPITEEFKFLENTISNKKDYVDLLIKLLHNKMKISKNENYREKIIAIICSDNSYIAKSSIIFNTIFSNFNLCPTDKTREIQNDNESINGIENYDGESENEDNEYEDINYNFDKDNDSEYNYSIYENSEEDDRYEEEDETGLLFLSELENEKTNSIIKTINKTNNKVLDEVLLSLFDKEFSKYFKNKKSNETLIFSQSLSIFKKCVEYIEKEKTKIKKDNRISILYCISYIKYYCYQFSKIVYEDKDDELPIYEIILFLKRESKIREIIKIYIIKLLYKLIIGNYNKTIEFIKEKNIFYEDFDFTEKIPCSLEYVFIQNDTFDNYKKLRKEFINSKNINFKSTNKILNLLEKEENKIKWILDFYDLMVNEEISHLSKSTLDENYEAYYDRLSQFNSTIIKNMKLSSLSANILNIYFNNHSIKRELSFIHSLPFSTYEMLLYSHKLAFICSFSQPNSVYSNILSPNVLQNLKSIYIPGGEPNDSLLIQSGDRIKEDFQNGTKNGIYICSCYHYYNIGGCGFPIETRKCKNCGKLIGGNNHELVQRQGHYRIFKDENQRINDYYVKVYHFSVPYMILSELMNKVENERRIQIKGLKRVKRDFYIDDKKKVRNISNVTYRTLSFIFYSCIYADLKIGYLRPNDLEIFYYSDVNNTNNNNNYNNLLSIMMDNYHSLIKELKIRGIENIQCFLNLIIPKIYPVIIENDKTLQTPNERNEFEMKCNGIIEDIIENYRNSNEIYIENNKKILEIKDDTIKSIIQETSNLDTLSHNKNYPLINYFTVTNYPNEDDFNKQFKLITNRNEIYPVTTSYINYREDKDNIINDILEIFKLINPFITYVLDKYNNKITRKDAKKILIKDELTQDKRMKKLFKSFQKGWKMIYGKLLNYDCNGDLSPKDITEECCLAYVLNDNLENDFGKYISTAYKTIITAQNEFLTSLISDNKRIIVQNANPKEIVSLNIESNVFDSFEDIVSTFSKRNYCFNKNGSIDYLNYKNINYDVNAIENELSKLLLSGKKLLKEEKEQEYINYAFEAFNQDETIITRFNEKINNKELLSNEEKTKLKHEIKSIDYKLVIFNMQSLFLYFINKKNITGNEQLSEEINKIPEKILRLDHEFKNIFQRHHFDITLNKLIDCYEYIENLNFPHILRNVPRNTELDEKEFNSLNLKEYINAYAKLTKQQKEMLTKHFENNGLIITKNDLRNAIRKYISRYMVNERYNKFNINVFNEIRYRSELWNDNINTVDHVISFNNEIKQLTNINIQIGQIINLYLELKSENTNQKPRNKNNKNNKNNVNNRRTNIMDVKGKRKADY